MGEEGGKKEQTRYKKGRHFPDREKKNAIEKKSAPGLFVFRSELTLIHFRKLKRKNEEEKMRDI